jgi:hypothetical protein
VAGSGLIEMEKRFRKYSIVIWVKEKYCTGFSIINGDEPKSQMHYTIY